MDISYWEKEEWFENLNEIIVGSGIVGLTCAIELLKKNPKNRILIIEKGYLPQGASNKNAGFACFGSLSEISDDLRSHNKNDVYSLVKDRWEGLNLLRKNIGDANLGYESNGGYELFLKKDESLYNKCVLELKSINKLLFPIFKTNVFSITKTPFGFQNVLDECIYNPFEGQIDVTKMMNSLVSKAREKGVKILTGIKVDRITQEGNVIINDNFEIVAKKIIVTTNGFSNKLINVSVESARSQVLITKTINNLKIKGIFHMDRGYYYFRDVGDRILFGGGRHLDKKVEGTDKFGLNDKIQKKLSELLENTILPETKFEIDHRWSGIMGIGKQKYPIIEKISKNIFCAVRLGGMGIAIGNKIGVILAKKVMK